MSKVANISMTSYCFDVVISHLNNIKIPKCPSDIPNDKYPLFVTWKKNNGNLRGCIGTFCRDLSLHQGLLDYAQTSAFRDTRFNPISLNELPSLVCSVSLLINFEPAKDYRDWVIGVHGIRIEYRQNGRRLNAVYLPEVAVEQNWNHVKTLDNLMHKGGFLGQVYENDRLSVVVERFQSEKVCLTYHEYCSLKRERGEEII